jgi:hypothetical protein
VDGGLFVLAEGAGLGEVNEFFSSRGATSFPVSDFHRIHIE